MVIDSWLGHVMLWIALAAGILFWYFWYGLECFLNGGTIMRHPWLFHFPLLYEEITWILPGGRKRRLDYVHGNVELAKTLPGIPHFIFTHILIPFGPAIAWLLLYGMW